MVMAIEPRVAKHAANATHLTHQGNAQLLARSAINVVLKITSAHVVGPK